MNEFPIYYYNELFEKSTNLNILNGKFIVGENVKFVYFKEQVSIVENFFISWHYIYYILNILNNILFNTIYIDIKLFDELFSKWI